METVENQIAAIQKDKLLEVEIEEKGSQRILLIDSMNMFIRSFAVLNLANGSGNHVGGMWGMMQSVKSIVELFHPTKVVFCWEGKHSSRKRKEILAEYKQGRDIKRSLNRTFQWETPEAEWESFKKQLYRVKEYLETLPVYQIEVELMEADDVIGYISQYLWLDQHKIIVSSDKDYFQLVTDKVSVYRPIKKEIIDVEHMIKEYKCYPKNWIMIKTLQGDSSDNVPGIKGIGLKTINKLFPFLIDSTPTNLDRVFEHCQANIKGSKFYKVILDEQEKLKKNWQVMQLLEHTFSVEGLEKVKSALNQNPVFKPFQLRLLFMQDSAFKQIQNFDSWNQIFAPLNSYEKSI